MNKSDKLAGRFVVGLHNLITKAKKEGMAYRDIVACLETCKFTEIYLTLTKED